MNNYNVWLLAKQVKLNVGLNISKGFDIGFDDRISPALKEKLTNFINWVEANYNIPITLWVDFEYKHYLLDRYKKRMGYMFYWADFKDYPNFDNEDDIPIIKLPVREEHSDFEEILRSFIEAITNYFAWILNIIDDDYHFDENHVEEILKSYLNT